MFLVVGDDREELGKINFLSKSPSTFLLNGVKNAANRTGFLPSAWLPTVLRCGPICSCLSQNRGKLFPPLRHDSLFWPPTASERATGRNCLENHLSWRSYESYLHRIHVVCNLMNIAQTVESSFVTAIHDD